MLDEKFGRADLENSKPPFVCGISGISYSASDVKKRVDFLARALARELKVSPNEGSEWEKVITIFAHNTVCHDLVIPRDFD